MDILISKLVYADILLGNKSRGAQSSITREPVTGRTPISWMDNSLGYLLTDTSCKLTSLCTMFSLGHRVAKCSQSRTSKFSIFNGKCYIAFQTEVNPKISFNFKLVSKVKLCMQFITTSLQYSTIDSWRDGSKITRSLTNLGHFPICNLRSLGMSMAYTPSGANPCHSSHSGRSSKVRISSVEMVILPSICFHKIHFQSPLLDTCLKCSSLWVKAGALMLSNLCSFRKVWSLSLST